MFLLFSRLPHPSLLPSERPHAFFVVFTSPTSICFHQISRTYFLYSRLHLPLDQSAVLANNIAPPTSHLPSIRSPSPSLQITHPALYCFHFTSHTSPSANPPDQSAVCFGFVRFFFTSPSWSRTAVSRSCLRASSSSGSALRPRAHGS